jgi:eukaryotic-like serine/threonine-protein kinase
MPSLPDEHEQLPERVAHFRPLERLGAGGMGVVYRAQDEKLLRIVALKVLAKTRAGDDTVRKRFLREARIAAGISHPNVAAIYEAGEDEGRIYIAMELAHGTTLRRRLERGPLEVREAVRIVKEIARGVGRAHAREVAHRDLKPDNVMVGDDGAVKVLDFGLAKPPPARPSSPPGPDSSSLTQVGRIVGTPGYMSPEQAVGNPVDVTTDVFSLGVILYELRTGRRPFLGETHLELVLATSRDTPTPPSRLNPSVPPELEAILDRCLKKDPAERYSTADGLLAALEGLALDARPLSKPPSARAHVRGTMPEESELYRRARSQIGTMIRGKYHLDRVLGVGGMAVVFEATHRNLKRFALKMLHPEVSLREDVRKRFLREGYAANVLAHPGAVAVLDDDVAEDGAAFLVMELLEGAGLDALWERCGCRLTPKLVLAVTCPLLEVLTAAHAKGIIHRDIKPPNVFLTHDGSVKVLDFGVARVRDAMAGPGATTGTGVLLGTAGFMAPEQAYARSKDIDAQTDVWAVGATMFTLLSGELVHEGENAQQLVIHAATSQGRSLAALAPDVPANVVELVERAIAFDKSARWPSADAMREAAEAAYLSMFGEAVSRAPLAELVQRVGPWPTSTPSSVSGLSSSSLARRAPALPSLFESTSHSIDRPGFLAKLAADERVIHRRSLTSPEAPSARQRASGRAPRAFPMTTAKPVSSEALDSAIATPRKERSAPWAFRATFITLIAGASVAVLAIDGRPSRDTAPEPLAKSSPAEPPSARAPPPEPKPSVAATTEPPASASASASTSESPSARASASTPARSFAAPSPAPRASVPSRTASAGSPKLAASSRAAPPPPPALAGSTGRLNVGATSGWCDVTVDGVARGATPVAGLELSAGPHVVTCTSATGSASTTVIVPADETVRYRFSP